MTNFEHWMNVHAEAKDKAKEAEDRGDDAERAKWLAVADEAFENMCLASVGL